MKHLTLLLVSIILSLSLSGQKDNPRIDLSRFQRSGNSGNLSGKNLPSSNNRSTESFDTTWADRFQTVLDSIMDVTDGKGASVSVYTPEEGLWTGVSGTSDGWTAITPEMRFGIGSNTKLFIAVALVKLQEEGILTLDDHLYQWLPSFPNIDSNTTIRQLLTHQSGIWDYWNENPSIFNQIWNDTSRFWTTEEIIASIGPPHFAPGNGQRYSNTNYVLAGMIIEAATGQTWVQKLHDLIFDPLDLDSTFVGAFEPRNGPVAAEWDAFFNHLITNSPMTAEYSQANACGAMLATSAEMVQWYNALFNGSLLSDSSLQQVLTFDPSSLYGLGVEEGAPLLYFHTGGMMGYVSIVLYDVQRKATICILCNDRVSDFGAKVNALFYVFFNEYPRKPNDAGIAYILAPREHICTNTITPEIAIWNNGSNTLTSVNINYQIDDDAVSEYDWIGSLAPGLAEMLILPSLTTDEGPHGFSCYTTLPNGEPEGYTWNDTLTSDFYVNTSTPLVTGVFEGFEGDGFPQAGWTLNSNSILQWGETTLTRFEGTGAGVKNNYSWFGSVGEYFDLQLPLMNISGLSNTDFSFEYAYTAYPGNMGDSLQVSVSEDCGATWETLFYKGGYTLRTAPYTPQIFYPDEPQEWKHEAFSLAEYEGDILIRFRMRFGNSNNLYIDNILVGAPVGIEESAVSSRQSAVLVYPNPTRGIVDCQLSIDEGQRVTLKLYDIHGRAVSVLFEGRLNTGEQILSFDLSELPSGIYFYEFRAMGKGQRAVGKLVKF